MNDLDSLFDLPVTKLTSTDKPELTNLVLDRRFELANRPKLVDTRLSYKTYEDDVADTEVYDPTDFVKVGEKIRTNVAKAIETRFPIVGDKHTLAIENLGYEKSKNKRFADEKYIIQHEQSLTDRLRGDWVLYDNASGKEIERKKATILNVPRMTERGTFIRNGSEQGLKHMFRLRPGIYARVKASGQPSVHINPAQTTGRQMSMDMEPSTGIMTLSRGTRTYGVLPMLIAAGVTPDTIKETWGEDLYKINYAKYAKLLDGGNKQFDEYKKLWNDDIRPIQLDEETTLGTMGTAYKSLSPAAFLDATSKVLKLARSMSPDDEDDRDSLAYQRIMGPADYIPERIVRDGGGLLRKLFQRVVKDGNLNIIESGAFQPQVDSVFLEDRHAGYIDGASPFEALDFSSMVSRIGEGGIGDIKAAPAETRGVNDSYLGFIDPIRCYSRNHEIMTSTGWKNITEIKDSDKIACLINGAVEYHKPDSIHAYDYNANLFSYCSKAVAYEVTGNHRMWVCKVAHKGGKKKSGGYQKEYNPSFTFEYAEDIHNTNRRVLTGGHKYYVGSDEVSSDVSEFDFRKYDIDEVDWASFMGWYLSEGSTLIKNNKGQADRNSVVTISQSKKVHKKDYEDICQLLSRLPWSFTADKRECNLYIKSHELAQYLRKFGYCNQKYIPAYLFDLSIEARKAFIDAMMRGDGRQPQGNEGQVYTTTSEKLSKGVERMLFDLGYCVTTHKYDDNRELRYLPTYEVRATVSKHGWLIKNGRAVTDRVERSDYYSIIPCDGKVFCVTVPGGMVYTRIPGHKGFWCGNSPESLKVGLDVYMSAGVLKDSKGNFYSKFRDKSGEIVSVPMGVAAKSYIATPEFFDPAGDPEEYIPAFNRGKGLEYIKRKDVDFYVANSNNMMSTGAGMIPNIGGIRSNRALMGSKYPLQALPLRNREAPLVQRMMLDKDGNDSTTEKVIAKQLGAKFAPVDGTVVSVNADEIVIKDRQGNKHTVDLYNNYPANQKGYLHNTAIVKPGDRVMSKQPIAMSNYTNDKGEAALGVNLRTAFLSAKGSGNFEDAIQISESAAKNKLASEQMYKFRGDKSSDTTYGKEKFVSLFGSHEFTKDQLDKIGDDGFPKPGVVFQKGDPVFLGTQIRDLSSSGLSRNAAVPYVKTWEHDEPGTVLDVVEGRKHMTIYTKSYTPMKVGDKMCFDEETEIFTTEGWVFFKDLKADAQVLTLDYETANSYFTEFDGAFKYYCDNEKLYWLRSKNLDIKVTKDHRHLVSPTPTSNFMTMQTSEEVYKKARYHLIGHDLNSRYSYASSREKGAKETWSKYTGWVYCVDVPKTHTVYVRRNGKCVWSGNSTRYGSKGVISAIIPDEQMPRDSKGRPFEVLQSPLGLPSRLNTAMLGELGLGKIAAEKGITYAMPDFIVDDTIDGFVSKELKKHGLTEKEDIYDPVTGKTIPNISTGVLFNYKLKHMSELKERGRGQGLYTSEDVPMKGEGAARRLGMMETSAVYSGGGFDVLKDAKLIRGQRNDKFWADYKDGKTPESPEVPLVHKKFLAHLRASGAKIDDTGDLVKLSTATNSDIEEMTGGRKVELAATFDAKNMQPVKGGLFDPEIFGVEGDQWGYVDLPEPVLNPLMFKPIASLLGWTDLELREYLQGARQIDGKFGSEEIIKKLDSIDLKNELKKAKDVLKADKTTLQQRDLARKRIRAIHPMLEQGKKPSEYFFNRMPILPPRFRTVVTMGDETNIAADANFLYKRMMDAAQDLTEAKNKLPGEYQVDARQSLYNAVNAVVGTMPTDDPKLENKGVSGLLKWAFGKGSPKLGSTHRKIFGSNLDLGGLGTIVPDGSLTIDQVGLPEDSAWKMFEPFVVRELRQSGFTVLDAIREVTDRTPEAKKALEEVMSKRPVLINRAPTLWRYGIQGQYAVLRPGKAIRVNPNICKTFNADFDGDTVLNSTQILISPEIDKRVLELAKNDDILFSVNKNNKENNMLDKETKVGLFNVRCSISDIPRIEDSKVTINENTTEWDVPEGVYTEAINKETGEKEIAPVTKLSLHKNVDMYDVTLSTVGNYKHIVTCTKNDTLLTYNNGKIEITDVDDALHRVAPKVKCFDKEMNPNYCVKYIQLGKQVPLTFDTGVFLGIMIGDGWVDANNATRIAAECPEIQKKVLEITRKEDSYLPVKKDSQLFEYNTERFGSSTAHRLTIYLEREANKDLKEKIGTGAYNKRIPLESMGGSKAHRLGVLIGLIATDGSVNFNKQPAKGKKSSQKSILFHTTSQLLRDNIIDLCFSLGIKATATPYKGTNSKVTCYAVNLSVRDVVRLYKEEPRFRMIAASDETALKAMVDDVIEEAKTDNLDIVPFPKHISILLSIVRGDLIPATEANRYKNQGFCSRDLAKKFVTRLKEFNYDEYTESGRGSVKDRPGYSIEEVKQHAEDWIKLVENEDIQWEVVSNVQYIGKLDGWDVTVPGPLTFTLGSGTFVQDSMSTHVPVSNEAIQAIDRYMLPSRNLLSPKNFKAHFIPRDASNEGLYLATRVKDEAPIRFKTQQEAEEAYDKGQISIDTPVEIG